MNIPNANCEPFLGKTERDLLAGILLASGGTPASVPNTSACPEWGYGKHTVRDILGGILLAIQNGGGGGVDLSSPPPIGDVTPNTGEFTDLVAATFQGVIGNVTPAAGTFTGLTVPLNALATTTDAGVTLINSTAATSGVPNQFSPAMVFSGTLWTGSASEVIQSRWVQGSPDPIQGSGFGVFLQTKQGAGAWTTRATIDSGGGVNAVGAFRAPSAFLTTQCGIGNSAVLAAAGFAGFGGGLFLSSGTGIRANGAATYLNPDAFFERAAAATWQLGQNHATTPTLQTFKAHDVTTGTGADLLLSGGTGSVANGMVRIGTHSAIGAETVTGYIEIKDAGGTVRKLAVVS